MLRQLSWRAPCSNVLLLTVMASVAAAAGRPLRFLSAWFCPFAQRAQIALEQRRVPYEFVEALGWNQVRFWPPASWCTMVVSSRLPGTVGWVVWSPHDAPPP